jgi:negative regulator of flagellin synthesis FlgM
MQIHGPAHVHGPQPINAPHRAAAPRSSGQVAQSSPVDQLDISPQADLVSRARDIPGIRAERVAEIRAQIAEGTYDTDAKLEAALDRLLDEMGG